MQEFKIEIEETLQRAIKVEAVSEEDAKRIVKEKYRNEEIILDELDFKEVNIKNIK
ncbi:MAG TPA: DpnD/PcfM family protein [Clostridia bacterium]|nr:DpnD/PcfM family protein [Clostridia bacterium]